MCCNDCQNREITFQCVVINDGVLGDFPTHQNIDIVSRDSPTAAALVPLEAETYINIFAWYGPVTEK